MLKGPTLINFGRKSKPLSPTKGTCTKQHMQRLEEERLISHFIEIANIFHTLFIGVSAHISISPEHAFAINLSVYRISQKCNHLQFSFLHAEVGYAKRLLDSLNLIIKYHLGFSLFPLSYWLFHVLNLTINAWSLWKRSNVSVLFKKDSFTDKVNYRPVSVLHVSLECSKEF